MTCSSLFVSSVPAVYAHHLPLIRPRISYPSSFGRALRQSSTQCPNLATACFPLPHIYPSSDTLRVVLFALLPSLVPPSSSRSACCGRVMFCFSVWAQLSSIFVCLVLPLPLTSWMLAWFDLISRSRFLFLLWSRYLPFRCWCQSYPPRAYLGHPHVGDKGGPNPKLVHLVSFAHFSSLFCHHLPSHCITTHSPGLSSFLSQIRILPSPSNLSIRASSYILIFFLLPHRTVSSFSVLSPQIISLPSSFFVLSPESFVFYNVYF